MSRRSAGVLTSAGSTTLPIISLYSVANNGGKLLEVGIFNTTATQVGSCPTARFVSFCSAEPPLM